LHCAFTVCAISVTWAASDFVSAQPSSTTIFRTGPLLTPSMPVSPLPL
jgi:hypothetical protein